MWEYNDIYRAVVTFISQDLRDMDFTLNFGVIALSNHSNLNFKLINLQTGRSMHWISVITGETIEELIEDVKVVVPLKKTDLTPSVHEDPLRVPRNKFHCPQTCG